MSNFTFACASVNGLTLAQKRETVKALRAAIKVDVANRKAARAAAKVEKAAAKEVKAAARAEKKAARIAKMEAKLAALKNPVGRLAIKAAKKPSKVIITKMAA